MKCFWCGEDIGRKHSVLHEVMGEKVPFHRGMFKDCLNEWMKSQRSQPEQKSRVFVRVGSKQMGDTW